VEYRQAYFLSDFIFAGADGLDVLLIEKQQQYSNPSHHRGGISNRS